MNKLLNLKSNSLSVVTAVVVLLCVLAGTAFATGIITSNTDSRGTLTGCYLKSTGVLRVTQPGQNCRSNEVAVWWNRQGKQGNPGKAGATGNTGATGNVGAPGLPGNVGAQGTQGNTGAQGETGAAGAKGDTGSAGATGAVGPAGAKGDTGNTGAAGAAGVAGPTGPAGPAGAKGDTGDTGPAGPQGPAGTPGGQSALNVSQEPGLLVNDFTSPDGQFATSYVLQLSDANSLVYTTPGTGHGIYYLSPNQQVPYPVGTWIDLFSGDEDATVCVGNDAEINGQGDTCFGTDNGAGNGLQLVESVLILGQQLAYRHCLLVRHKP